MPEYVASFIMHEKVYSAYYKRKQYSNEQYFNLCLDFLKAGYIKCQEVSSKKYDVTLSFHYTLIALMGCDNLYSNNEYSLYSRFISDMGIAPFSIEKIKSLSSSFTLEYISYWAKKINGYRESVEADVYNAIFYSFCMFCHLGNRVVTESEYNILKLLCDDYYDYYRKTWAEFKEEMDYLEKRYPYRG
jgi:hypothetical protein